MGSQYTHGGVVDASSAALLRDAETFPHQVDPLPAADCNYCQNMAPGGLS